MTLAAWEQTRADIQAVLEDGRGHTLGEIAETIGEGCERIYGHLDAMIYLGRVEEVEEDGEIRYVLTEPQPEEEEQEPQPQFSRPKGRRVPAVRGKRHFAQLRDGDIRKEHARRLTFSDFPWEGD